MFEDRDACSFGRHRKTRARSATDEDVRRLCRSAPSDKRGAKLGAVSCRSIIRAAE
jgi:hypothetical protein